MYNNCSSSPMQNVLGILKLDYSNQVMSSSRISRLQLRTWTRQDQCVQKSILEFYVPYSSMPLWKSNRVTMLHIGGRVDLPLLYTTHNSHYNLLEKAER